MSKWQCFSILILSLKKDSLFVLRFQRHRLKANWMWCYSHLVYNFLMFKLSHQLLLYTHDWSMNLILIAKAAEFNCREIKDLIYNCILRAQDLPTRWQVSQRQLRYLNPNVHHGLFSSIVPTWQGEGKGWYICRLTVVCYPCHWLPSSAVKLE